MDPSRLVAVIMAGGGGTRFWPRSRRLKPKQFLSFAGEASLLRQTVARLEGMVPLERTLVITGAEHAALAREHTGLPASCIIAEPERRDTAACIGLGARLAERIREDAVLLVLSADHLIEPAAAFRDTMMRAAAVASEHDALVAIGLRPMRPAVGFGYIETSRLLDDGRPAAWRVESFREKPDLETARRFLAAGNFLWNSGIFAFQAKTVLEAIRTHVPELHAGLARLKDPRDPAELYREYPGLPKISIDFGVMERAQNRLAVEATFNWDDVGTFDALARYIPADAAGNVARGDAVFLDAKNVLVDNDVRGLVVVSGVSDLLVVRSGDVVMILPRKDAESVKGIVDRLAKEGRHDVL
ncbi:MAG TPA: mannose-1-phosphate guanylyltransferase [Planctomycetota bacterium]|nr:mannose-1-phosphate guanylyltransferase [Planctomycetota bacterium]